jgi:N-acetylmuramoyl-L-alanine amidase
MLNSVTQMPNVLVETAFLSNPEEEILLMDDKFQKKIAGQITLGIEEFLRNNSEVKERNDKQKK